MIRHLLERSSSLAPAISDYHRHRRRRWCQSILSFVAAALPTKAQGRRRRLCRNLRRIILDKINRYTLSLRYIPPSMQHRQWFPIDPGSVETSCRSVPNITHIQTILAQVDGPRHPRRIPDFHSTVLVPHQKTRPVVSDFPDSFIYQPLPSSRMDDGVI